MTTDKPGMAIEGARGWRIWAIAAVAVAFGLLTIREGGAVLFGSEEARAAAGHYVPFVLWFNFLAGFAYVAAGVGAWARRRWAVALAVFIAAATLAAFAAFGAYILADGAYELRTVAAMTMRSLVWIALSWLGYRWIPRRA